MTDTPTDAINPVALRPCPFCGGERRPDVPAMVICGGCGASTRTFGNTEDAETQWNHREPDPEYLREMLRAANARADAGETLIANITEVLTEYPDVAPEKQVEATLWQLRAYYEAHDTPSAAKATST